MYESCPTQLPEPASRPRPPNPPNFKEQHGQLSDTQILRQEKPPPVKTPSAGTAFALLTAASSLLDPFLLWAMYVYG